MIKYTTITIDDYLKPEGSELPDSIEVEIMADVSEVEDENGGGFNVGDIYLDSSKHYWPELQIIILHIDIHEEELKEKLANS